MTTERKLIELTKIVEELIVHLSRAPGLSDLNEDRYLRRIEEILKPQEEGKHEQRGPPGRRPRANETRHKQGSPLQEDPGIGRSRYLGKRRDHLLPFPRKIQRLKRLSFFRDDSGDRIWCFAERRMYLPYDVFKLGLTNKNPETIFRRIWAQLNEGTKESLIQSMENPVNTLPENWDEVLPILDRFQTGEASFQEVLTELIKLRNGTRI